MIKYKNIDHDIKLNSKNIKQQSNPASSPIFHKFIYDENFQLFIFSSFKLK